MAGIRAAGAGNTVSVAEGFYPEEVATGGVLLEMHGQVVIVSHN